MKPKLIISVRGAERIEILGYAIKFAQTSTVPMDIVIVEQDKDPLYSWVDKWGCEYIHAYNPLGFNRSWGFNVGVRNSDRAYYYMLSDADLLITPDLVEKSLKTMIKRDHGIILPYKNINFVALSDVKNNEPITDNTMNKIKATCRLPRYTHDASCGGICLCTYAYFEKAQGYNELYECWGCEDVDWSHKAYHLTGKQLSFNRTDDVLLHIRHKTMIPGYQSRQKHQENINLTRKIWVENKEETIKALKEGTLQPEWGDLKKYEDK